MDPSPARRKKAGARPAPAVVKTRRWRRCSRMYVAVVAYAIVDTDTYIETSEKGVTTRMDGWTVQNLVSVAPNVGYIEDIGIYASVTEQPNAVTNAVTFLTAKAMPGQVAGAGAPENNVGKARCTEAPAPVFIVRL